MKFEEVSVDEVLNQRKSYTNDKGTLFKAHSKAAKFNEADGSANFVMSAEVEDRMGDVVMQNGIDRSAFDPNPIAFFNHRSMETPIGQWSNIKTIGGKNKRTEGTMTFVEEGMDDVADKVRRHVKAGSIRAASIGFIPKSAERILDEDSNWTYGYRFPDIELLECSVVCVPAVREALMRSADNDIEIVTPEIYEEFLEDLKSHPAIAAEIDRKHFEDVVKAAGGNKTYIVFEKAAEPAPEREQVAFELSALPSASQEAIKNVESALEILSKSAEDLPGVSINVDIKSLEVEPVEDEPNPVQKDAEAVLETATESLTEKLQDVPEDDEEGRGLLQSMIDGLKGLFGKEPEPEPEIAGEEIKVALAERLEKIKSRNQTA